MFFVVGYTYLTVALILFRLLSANRSESIRKPRADAFAGRNRSGFAPMPHEPGVIAYDCLNCGYVTSVPATADKGICHPKAESEHRNGSSGCALIRRAPLPPHHP
jgi:hypothetical protein